MDLRILGSVFMTIFLSELGDKTQLATLSFAAAGKDRLTVFLGAAAALAVTSLIGVYFGGFLARAVPGSYIKIGAGCLFIVIGALFLLNKL